MQVFFRNLDNMVRKLFVPLFALAFAILPAVAKPVAKPDGYVIRQHLLYQGPLDMKARPDGIHVETKELGVYFRPEIKGILLLNRANKKYCIIDPQIWVANKHKKGVMTDIRKTGTKMFKGVHLQGYAGVMEDTHHNRLYVAQFWTTKDIPLPQAAVDDYCKIFGIPSGYGLPIELIKQHGAKPEPFLQTLELRTATVAPSETKPPLAGFQRVADELDVMMAEAPDEDLNALLKSDHKTMLMTNTRRLR